MHVGAGKEEIEEQVQGFPRLRRPSRTRQLDVAIQFHPPPFARDTDRARAHKAHRPAFARTGSARKREGIGRGV